VTGRSPRFYAGACGLANGVLGLYVTVVMTLVCVQSGFPGRLGEQLALLGLFVGGAVLGVFGFYVWWRSRTTAGISGPLGLLVLLGLPAGLGSATFYVVFVVVGVFGGQSISLRTWLHWVALGAVFGPLPVWTLTGLLWVMHRRRLGPVEG
jgi:hypothetical protein